MLLASTLPEAIRFPEVKILPVAIKLTPLKLVKETFEANMTLALKFASRYEACVVSILTGGCASGSKV